MPASTSAANLATEKREASSTPGGGYLCWLPMPTMSCCTSVLPPAELPSGWPCWLVLDDPDSLGGCKAIERVNWSCLTVDLRDGGGGARWAILFVFLFEWHKSKQEESESGCIYCGEYRRRGNWEAFLLRRMKRRREGREREDFKGTYKSICCLLSYMPMSAGAAGKVGTFPIKMQKFLRKVIQRGRSKPITIFLA